MKEKDFLRPYHNVLTETARTVETNSVINPADVPEISAYISASGTALAQPGRPTAVYAHIPNFSAGLVPSGQKTPTGYTHYFLIAQAGTPNAHIMAYSKTTINQRLKSSEMIPTARR